VPICCSFPCTRWQRGAVRRSRGEAGGQSWGGLLGYGSLRGKYQRLDQIGQATPVGQRRDQSQFTLAIQGDECRRGELAERGARQGWGNRVNRKPDAVGADDVRPDAALRLVDEHESRDLYVRSRKRRETFQDFHFRRTFLRREQKNHPPGIRGGTGHPTGHEQAVEWRAAPLRGQPPGDDAEGDAHEGHEEGRPSRGSLPSIWPQSSESSRLP